MAESNLCHEIEHRRCLHCETEIVAKRSGEFCCDGCQAVYSLLHAKDLAEFYQIKGKDRLRPVDSLKTQADFLSLDLLENRSAISLDGSRMDFFVDDLSCAACVWILDRLETVSSDVIWSRVNLSRSSLTVAKVESANFSDIAQLIRSLGFNAEPVAAESSQDVLQRNTLRRGLIRTAILAALTGNIMLLSVSLYGGADGRLGQLFQWVMAALTLPIVTWGAWPLYLNSWRSFRARRLSLDVPIAIAVIAGFTAGAIGLLTGSDMLYFDSVAMLVFLLMASRTALDHLKHRFASVDTIPQWLLQSVIDTQSGARLLPTQIEAGRQFQLFARQRLPVDAAVEESGVLWDVSVLTGESRPHESQVGEVLSAGSVLLSKSAVITARGRYEDSRIAKLLKEWREGRRDRKELSQMSDRVGQVFTFVVLAMAITLISYENAVGFTEGPNGWLRALALLLAACPCVFGIGIPLAENLVMQGLSRQGLIVREPSFLQKLAVVRQSYFDKTGTLTTGRMQLAKIANETNMTMLADDAISEDLILQVAEAIERNDAHPIARAICTEVHLRKLRPLDTRSASPLYSNQKVSRLIGRQAEVRIGTNWSRFQIETLASEKLAETRVRLSVLKHHVGGANLILPIATLTLRDEIRAGSRELLDFLQRRMDVGILSGDRTENVEMLSNELSIARPSAWGDLKPEQKAELVSANSNFSFMLGDGANDAEALKRSFASTSLKGDLSVCLEAADSVLIVDSLVPLVSAFKMADRLQLTLIATLVMSASINILSAIFAITGLLTPMIAAILMPTSGLIVTTTTWLMLREPSFVPIEEQEAKAA